VEGTRESRPHPTGLATRLDAYASFVSTCESGERRIDVVELATFCRRYGIDLVKILRSTGISS
jgi:hypothetical protein